MAKKILPGLNPSWFIIKFTLLTDPQYFDLGYSYPTNLST